MSLNLIIMLIIGMVVLGLVIGFVNSLVSKGVEGFDDQIGENQQLKLNDVKASPDNLAVLPEPSIDVKIGGKTNIFIKARAYGSLIDCGAGELNTNCASLVTYDVVDEDGTTDATALIVTGPGFDADVGKEDAKMYTLKPGTTGTVGTYYLTFSLYGGEETKTLTVTVK